MSNNSPAFSSSSGCCIFHIQPLSFSPEQAAADHRTILSFMSSSSRKSSPKTSPTLTTPPSSSSSYICRICRSEESDVRLLLSPCLCSGSLAHVHPACLLQWIETRPAADPLAVINAATLTAAPALSLSSSAQPSTDAATGSAQVCELCQASYRIRYTYTPNTMSCNSALLHLTLDSLLVALLLALSLLLTLSLPAGTSALLWWSSLVSASGLGVVSLGLVVRRYYYKNASVTIVAAEEEEGQQRPQRPQRMSMGGLAQDCGVLTKATHHAVGDEYVKLDCRQQQLGV